MWSGKFCKKVQKRNKDNKYKLIKIDYKFKYKLIKNMLYVCYILF